MKNFKLLKKLIPIAELSIEFGDMELYSHNIQVNFNIPERHLIEYAFFVLEVPYSVFKPNIYIDDVPVELSFVFGEMVNPKLIYFLTKIMYEIFPEQKLTFYISYDETIENYFNRVVIGSFYFREGIGQNYISHPIEAKEILDLDILQINSGDIKKTFPNLDGDSYSEESISNTAYSKYNAAYGLDDSSIDNAFEGSPENYWNVE